MRAAVFPGLGQPLTIQDLPRPSIGSHQMLVRVHNCGICGTDIHATKAGAFLAPDNTVFGHEFSGEVVEIGRDIEGKYFQLGDRIISLPFIEQQTIGLGEVDGAYAEYVRVHYDSALKLPTQLNYRQGALVEPLAVGLHAVKKAGPIAEQNVLIIGAGPIGLAVAIWARFFGAKNVVISELSPQRIKMAQRLGFDQIINDTPQLDEKFMAYCDGPAQVQFECVGVPGLLQQCIQSAPSQGKIIGVGLCNDPDTIVPLLAFTKELCIQWVVAYEKSDFQFTIDMMVQQRINADAMITDIVSLDQLPQAFEALRKPSSQCKVLLELPPNG